MKPTSSQKTFEENAVFALVSIGFGYFLYQLFFFATHISPYVPPDEITRFGMCQVFSQTFWLPENSEATYHLGLITHIPYLYYVIMGKLLNLNFSPLPDLIFLRLINCMLSFVTVIYGYKWIQLITQNRFCHLLFLFLLTNTPMFSFISASVSYDNLTNLFSAMAIYYLHFFFQKSNLTSFFLFAIAILGGALTKTAFLPLVLAYLGIFIFYERKYLKIIFPTIKNILSALTPGQKILLGLAILLLILNIKLYLGNLLQFGAIEPGSEQILTEEQSLKYRVNARNIIFSQYKSGKITFEEAVQKANKIQHPGDRNSTLQLIEIARMNTSNPIILMDRIQYAWIWMKLMLHRSVGIAGHLFMVKDSYFFGIYQIIFLLSFLLFIRYWKPDDGSYMTDAIFLCLFYAVILMQLVNYRIYTNFFSTGIGLQGRYFFPVLIPFYGIMAYYLTHPFKKLYQIIIFLLISSFFIWGDFAYFLQHATPHWFFS